MTQSDRDAWRSDIKKRWEGTRFLVEADDFTQTRLWVDHHNQVKWEDFRDGINVCITKTAIGPLHVQVNWTVLDGVLVAFYEATSDVVVYSLMEDWIKDKAPQAQRTNAQNFHHVLLGIREINAEAKKDET